MSLFSSGYYDKAPAIKQRIKITNLRMLLDDKQFYIENCWLNTKKSLYFNTLIFQP